MKRIISLFAIFTMIFQLTVPAIAVGTSTYKVTISKSNGGSVEGAGRYEEGEEVTLSAVERNGYEFTGWSRINGIEIDDATNSEITFTMPANTVSMKAEFRKVPTYKVTVSKSSGGNVDGTGSYKEGEEVTLTAEPKNGYEFSGWSRINGIEIEDATESEIVFLMPVNKVSIRAEFSKVANKVSVSKSGSGTVEGIGTYNRGEEVTLTAVAKSGYEFTGWTSIKGVEIEDTESEEITFTMPLCAVSMKANFRKVPTYKVTVSGVTGGTVEGVGSYKDGEEVTITAVAKNGYEFIGWNDVRGIETEDVSNDEISFEMPANNVSMKAEFSKVANKVSVSKSGSGTVEGVGTYNRGEEVTLTAVAKNGYEFTGWTSIKGVEIEDTESEEITFTMPLCEVSMKANFKKVPTYKVSVSRATGGTVEGIGSYKEGAEVTIVAEAKAGYKFVGWSSIKGIEMEDVLDDEINFEMPANSVSMKANFEKVGNVLTEAWKDLETNCIIGKISLYDEENEVTRKEMAMYVGRIIGISDFTANENRNESSFTDVSEGDEYTGWINLVNDAGLMGGYPDGTFRPDETITINQAITVIINALGRGEYVGNSGTWPANYISDAVRLGLTENIINHNNSELTLDNLVIMLHNALDLGTWEIDSVSISGDVSLRKSTSLRTKYFTQKRYMITIEQPEHGSITDRNEFILPRMISVEEGDDFIFQVNIDLGYAISECNYDIKYESINGDYIGLRLRDINRNQTITVEITPINGLMPLRQLIEKNYRDNITSINFENTTTIPENAVKSWVFNGKNSIVAWVIENTDDTYILTVAQRGGVELGNGNIFEEFKALKSINFENLSTSNVTDMRGMFSGCEALEELDLSSFDTSNVTDMSYMFNGCSSLRKLNLKNFDTSEVKYMNYMFRNCEELLSLATLDLDMSNVRENAGMFEGTIVYEPIQIGVVTGNSSLVIDKDYVEYLRVRLMTTDGSKGNYKIYDPKYCDLTDTIYDPGFEISESALKSGDIILFKSTTTKIIPVCAVTIPTGGCEYSIDYQELFAKELETAINTYQSNSVTTVNADGNLEEETMLYEDITYMFNEDTKLINTKDIEVVTALPIILNDANEFVGMEKPWIFIDRYNNIKYFLADVEQYNGVGEYGVLTDIAYFPESRYYEATIYYNGDEFEYKIADSLTEIATEGDFIKYTLVSDKIVTLELLVDTDEISELRYNDIIYEKVKQTATSLFQPLYKDAFIVDEVVEGYIKYEQLDQIELENAYSLDDLELNDCYIIYDLRTNVPYMLSNIEDIIGEYVIGFETKINQGADILVVVK